MGCSGDVCASGLRGMALLPVEGYGARVSGGAPAAPGGQWVEALGGVAVALAGVWDLGAA